MILIRIALGAAVVLTGWPFLTAESTAEEAIRSTAPDDQGAAKPVPANRQLRRSGGLVRVRRRDPNSPPWKPAPIPATIPIEVSGVARDEARTVVAGATITLYSITDKGSKPVGAATTDAAGRYAIGGAAIPLWSSSGGGAFWKEISPYASFILCGRAPGLGIAWSPQSSMYAWKEPHPDDIQGRRPLGEPVAIDLIFPKAAHLEGKVVDEQGRPVEGATLQVGDCDLLDEAGRETNNRQGYDWKSLPGSVGRARTDRDGNFRIEGLADRACYWIFVNRAETENATLSFYAATIEGPDTIHEQPPPDAFNGRLRHEVRTNPLKVGFPRIRTIAVRVVGEDTGRPIEGASVATLGDTLATGIVSYGTTDAAGNLLLGLPPGKYRGICADPPLETKYIRTYQRPLVVTAGDGAQPCEIRQQAGAELIFQAVRFGSGGPVPGAFFWKAPEDQPEATQQIEPSTFAGRAAWTGEDGQMRAVLPPEPGRRYRFRFAGIRQPNHPPGIHPDMANKEGYEAFPLQSAPVELTPGKTTRLKFVIRKSGEGEGAR